MASDRQVYCTDALLAVPTPDYPAGGLSDQSDKLFRIGETFQCQNNLST